MRHYPAYIPEQIRQDYGEANMILEASPKAAGMLLRRCLQGILSDHFIYVVLTLSPHLQPSPLSDRR